MTYEFDAHRTLGELEQWVHTMMHRTGGNKAVVGISGGKDSSVTATLMVRCLGTDNVIGILMPDGHQTDIEYSRGIVDHLGIASDTVDIAPMTTAFLSALTRSPLISEASRQTRLNLPPRVRMTLLYAIAQSLEDARVINTSNLSEDWVGYATVYGDTAGAFAPLGMLTTAEVIAIGRVMGVPEQFLVKPPSDGLTGRTDEDVLGFRYETLNDYLRKGVLPGEELLRRIDDLHRLSRFKFEQIPMFDPHLPIRAKQVGQTYPSTLSVT